MARQKKLAKPPSRPPRSRPRPASRRFHLPGWVRDLVAVTGLLAVVVAFFWPVLTGRAFFWEDFPELSYPIFSYTASELRVGRIPLWNPYLFGGIPFFAMIDNGVLYPGNWLLVPFVRDQIVPFFVVECQVIAHVLLLGVGTYLCGRSLGLSREGSFAAAVIYMLCGKIVHHVFHVALLHPITWFPFVFLLFVRAIDRMSVKTAIAAGGMMGVLIAAGHPQIFLYVSYTLALYTLFSLIGRYRASGWSMDLLRVMGLSLLVIFLGTGLTAVALLPMYELAGLSVRPTVTYEVATSYSLHLQELITLLMPDFYGRADPTQWNYWGPGYQEYGHFWEMYTYYGIMPLFLAGVALTLRRDRMTRYFGVLALVAFLLSLGGSTPVYRMVYEWLPGIDRFRAPGRFGMICGFAVGMLGGYGLDALRRMGEQDQARLRRYLQVSAGVFILSIFVYLVAEDAILGWLAGSPEFLDRTRAAMAEQSGPSIALCLIAWVLLASWHRLSRWRTVLTACAVAFILSDLFTAGYAFNLGAKGPEAFYPRNELVEFLKERQAVEGGRANIRSGPHLLMTRNAGMLYRIQTLQGYTSPLRLEQTIPPRYGDDLMNVTYRIHVDQEAGVLGLAPNPTAMPRAFVVRRFVVAEGMKAVEEAMADSAFDYRTTVVLDAAPSIQIPPDAQPAPEQPVITQYEPNRLEVQVDMTRPGMLVVGEVYYPAWRVYVNGHPGRLYRANGTMRAVALPAGAHTVTFRYESTWLHVGAVISGVSLITVVCAGVMTWRKRRKRRKKRKGTAMPCP